MLMIDRENCCRHVAGVANLHTPTLQLVKQTVLSESCGGGVLASVVRASAAGNAEDR
jgi:hypothetical protein